MIVLLLLNGNNTNSLSVQTATNAKIESKNLETNRKHITNKNYLYPLSSLCWITPCLACLVPFGGFGMRSKVTGRLRTSCLHISQVLFPFMLNHFIAHSWCANASSPLQLHSIFRVSPPSVSSTIQIRHTASSSGISSPPSWTSVPDNKICILSA